MSTYTEEMSDKLNALLEKTYDAEKGFEKAAENTDNVVLKNFFTAKSKERCNFGKNLKSEIKLFGEAPDKGGSFAGTAHRAWMDVKAFFSSNTDEAMLEEAIRGEKAAVEEYEEILKDRTLPPTTATMLLHQKNKIESTLLTVKKLENLA